MKIFAMLSVAFLAHNTDRKTALLLGGVPSSSSLSMMTTKREAEECFKLKVRRRLLKRFVNNEKYEGLDHPHLKPGDVVKQKSLLLDPVTKEEIGSVHTLANVLDDEVRLAQGAYNITKGKRIGVINFHAMIPNYLATEVFDIGITSGTGHFHSAQGFIHTTKNHVVDGALERDATLNICGLYEE